MSGKARHRADNRPVAAVAVLVAAQLAAGIGLYAIAAHLVVHLRHDLGLLASTASLIVIGRTAAQYALYAPAGLLADRYGASASGAAACLVRACGFTLLGVADHPGSLVAASILIGIGGAVYTPAGQALLAGLPGSWPQRGFAWYTAGGQTAAVTGPMLGLALIGAAATSATGFRNLAWLAGALWAVAALMFAALRRSTSHRRAASDIPSISRLATLMRHRALWRFIALTCPATLMITQASVAVPLLVPDRRLVTLYLAGAALVTSLAQVPRCRPFAIHHGLTVGFAGTGGGYLLLGAIPLGATGSIRTGVLVVSAALLGACQGVLLPALFYHGNRLAPPGALASYIGVRSFISGLVALVGALLIGTAFDHGRFGAVIAIAMIGAAGLGTAALLGRIGPTPSAPAPDADALSSPRGPDTASALLPHGCRGVALRPRGATAVHGPTAVEPANPAPGAGVRHGIVRPLRRPRPANPGR